MPIKLLSFDLDDTLLRDDLTIAPSDLAAIAQAAQRGITIVPASGRRIEAMEPTLHALGHRGPVISLNGALLSEYPAQTPLYERFVPLEIALEVAQAAQELGAYLQTYVENDYQFESECEFSALYRGISGKGASGKGGSAVGNLAAFLRKTGQPSQKLLFVETDPDKMAALRREMDARFSDRLLVFYSKAIYLELTHPEASKGAALRHLAREMGLAPQEVMAIGDGENDLSMLRYAGVGVAMGNAPAHVQKAVGRVTDTNMQGGVGAAIRRYALGGD